MTTNSITSALIKEEIKRTGGNLSKVARALGLDYYALIDQRKRELANRRVGVAPATGPEPDDIRVLGRPGHQHNVIAVKRQGQAWPAHFAAAIADARDKFDAGTHEMFQTTDNGWVVQYLIPRLKPAPRRKFFSEMVVM
ncbi:hypothetical protein ACCS91_33590 [Rhizobium ruizarguesonis]|uniref:hypothetical protein n=1 Tax=Rhizobium ruizarguesonis TaxID=2081791 RepID=UPI00163A177F|nr:hypothetical protein [Rhizobium ruizarguesonis]MBC2806631.1 hypothetical protein [Rhizobium ruizarguesonis]